MDHERLCEIRVSLTMPKNSEFLPAREMSNLQETNGQLLNTGDAEHLLESLCLPTSDYMLPPAIGSEFRDFQCSVCNIS